jgi:hypothetical protein
MKRTIILVFFTILALTASAQDKGKHHARDNQPKFSPEQFDADLQQFITTEAGLTPQEAARFFPVYREMQRKQRALYAQQRRQGNVKPQDEEGCQKRIRERDEIDLKLKYIQQTYHAKFLELLPATKVYDIINAEDRFHRRMLRNWGRPNQEKKK